jgi:hypothetical protein
MCAWQASNQRSRGQAEVENGYCTEVQWHAYNRGAAVPPSLILPTSLDSSVIVTTKQNKENNVDFHDITI